MQLFGKINKKTQTILLNNEIKKINCNINAPATIEFTNGEKCSSSCIKCHNPRCIYSKQNTPQEEIKFFINDKNNLICPVGAIRINENTEFPEIDYTKCIKCGLCSASCPLGAIYYNNKFIVNTNTNDKMSVTSVDKNSITKQEVILNNVKNKKENCFVEENEELLNYIYEQINTKIKTENDINNFVKNLINLLGIECFARRTGDNYTRMDCIYRTENKQIGTIEVEFGTDTLSASRRTLEDVAVLHSRYSIDKQDNKPLVVCLNMSNFRQGYWQVLKDIKTVENIKICTLTIGALLILVWNNCKLKDEQLLSFYADFDNDTIREPLTNIIKRAPNISNKFLGILEPKK